MSDAPQAGWYPDPTGRHEHRWWDGKDWSDQVADAGATAVDPVRGGGAAAATAGGVAGTGAGPTQATPVQPTTPQSAVPAQPPGAPPGAPGAPPPGAGVGAGPLPGGVGASPPPGANYVTPTPAGGGGNKMGLIIGAVVVVVLAVVIGLVLTSGGDDSGSSTAAGDSGSETATTQHEPSASDLFDDMADNADNGDDPLGGSSDTTVAPSETTAPADTTSTGGEAYPEAVINNFVNACTGSGASADLCNCTIDQLQQNVTYERFVEIDQQLAANPNDVPQELTDAVNACQ